MFATSWWKITRVCLFSYHISRTVRQIYFTPVLLRIGASAASVSSAVWTQETFSVNTLWINSDHRSVQRSRLCRLKLAHTRRLSHDRGRRREITTKAERVWVRGLTVSHGFSILQRELKVRFEVSVRCNTSYHVNQWIRMSRLQQHTLFRPPMLKVHCVVLEKDLF